ncbi:hypothetical protein [Streptomyces phaeochromogenes]
MTGGRTQGDADHVDPFEVVVVEVVVVVVLVFAVGSWSGRRASSCR